MRDDAVLIVTGRTVGAAWSDRNPSMNFSFAPSDRFGDCKIFSTFPSFI